MVDRALAVIKQGSTARGARAAKVVISQTMRLAARHGAVAYNPVREVARIDSKPTRPPRSLTAEERQQWLDAVDASDCARATYNRMRKANVLMAAGDLHPAAATAQRSVAEASEWFPHLLPVCLRQEALTSARLRDEHGARAAIERAVALTQATVDASDSDSPYCTTSYVQMEAALCLLHLRQPVAVEEACMQALADWPDELVRDRVLCLARRGVALVELREVDEACRTAMLALDGVRSAPSGRALHMLRVIATRLRPVGRNTSVRELTEALAEVA